MNLDATTGKLASLSSPDGETLTYTYDGSLLTRTTWSGELIRQEAKSLGQPVFTADYTRDRLGRITRKVETIQGITDTWDYTYDPAGRLQEVDRN